MHKIDEKEMLENEIEDLKATLKACEDKIKKKDKCIKAVKNKLNEKISDLGRTSKI